MTQRIGFEDPQLQRMEQATLWLQRMRSAGQDDRVVEDWLDWCQSDPLNQQAFDEIAAVWELSARLPREPDREATPRASTSRRALVASLAGVVMAGVAGAWWWTQSHNAVIREEFASAVGVNTVKELVDGSVVELGGGTRVTVSISQQERHVELHEGELFVRVRHDNARPFVVSSGWFEVVATGTAFDVLRTSERTTVTVTEGSVAAFHEGRAAQTSVRLQPGQQLVYSHGAHSLDVREADPAHAIAWRSGMLYFRGEPLSEVIASLNRYSPQGIVTGDPRIRQLPYGGTARTDAAGIRKWLEAAPGLFDFPVRVTELADGRWLIAPVSDATD